MVYTTLSGINSEAKRKKRQVIIGGDFNAEVGRNTEATHRSTLGKYGTDRLNARGRWLVE
eukprot:9444123-Karenia_brevis.AAC.1